MLNWLVKPIITQHHTEVYPGTPPTIPQNDPVLTDIAARLGWRVQ